MATGRKEVKLIKWGYHANSLLRGLEAQFQFKINLDVSVTCEGKFVQAHKVVLTACSPYFQNIFHQLDPREHAVIALGGGLQFDVVKTLIEFMYSGEIVVSRTDLKVLLDTAETLQVRGLGEVRQMGAYVGMTRTPGEGQWTSQSMNESGCRFNGFSSSSTSPSSTTSSSASPSSGISENYSSGGPTFLQMNPATNNTVGNSGSGTNFIHERPTTEATNNESPYGQILAKNTIGQFKKLRCQDGYIVGVEDDGDAELPKKINNQWPRIPDNDGVVDSAEWNNGQNSILKSYIDQQQEKKAQAQAGSPGEQSERIRRPPNAFVIFSNEWRKKLAMEFPGESNQETSIRLGSLWKNLPDETKGKYFEAADKADEDHKKKYPNYSYSPQAARINKSLKRQQQQLTSPSKMMPAGPHPGNYLIKSENVGVIKPNVTKKLIFRPYPVD